MKLSNILIALLVGVLLVTTITACSNGNSPVEPVINEADDVSQDAPISFGTENENRSMLAVYNAVIDPDAKTFTVEPANRSAEYHFPLNTLFPYILQITDYGWTPYFWAKIKLSHPYPGSGVDGFDPRVIAILPANPGISFNYPVLDANANNSVILEPDGYTKLFDAGGSIPGNTNPFKAYFKDQPNRVWSSTGVTEETQLWRMDLSGFGGLFHYFLVVDVSSNYPDTPHPVIDNAVEPVSIEAAIGPGLYSTGGTADITVTLLDWQGESGIGDILIEAPDLFPGTTSLAYIEPGPNPNEYIYSGTIQNSLIAPTGEYKILVAAQDQMTGIFVYDEFTVYVNYDSGDNGNLFWVKQAGGISSDAAYELTNLSDDSTVVTGSFCASSTFGIGEMNETNLPTTGLSEIFIARYNPDGTLEWVKRTAGTVDSRAGCFGITSLSDDSTVVTGQFTDSITLGENEPNQTVLTSSSDADLDMVIARYNPDGTLAWAKSAFGPSADCGRRITTLSDDSTVVTGIFIQSATFGSGEINETTLNSGGWYSIFTACYNPDGTLQWAKKAGGSVPSMAFGITSLSDDSTCITGLYKISVTFGEGEINETILETPDIAWDIFIARYNTDGTLAWAKRAGGVNAQGGNGITTLSDDSTVVTGSFVSSCTFGEGEPNQTVLNAAGDLDMFVARYNTDGTLDWAKQTNGNHSQSYAITALSDNSIVVSGYFKETTIFGLGELKETILVSAGDKDILIARYNPDGTFEWAKRAGDADDDIAEGITVLSDDSTVVTGYFYETATFGPGEINETLLTTFGYRDIFIARFISRK